MSKVDFLHFPEQEFCTTTLSYGPPGCGKTYMVLMALKYWIDKKMFDKYVCVIPAFKNEMEKSYDWLNDHLDVVDIYEAYDDSIATEIVKMQEKNNKLFDAKKIKKKPRIFFMCDDATGQKGLFESPSLLRMVIENRHLNVHSWFLLHRDKGVIKPALRENMKFVFLYPVHVERLKALFTEYINFMNDFENFNEFKEFWREYILKQEHGCLFVMDRTAYNPFCSKWFDNSK